MEGGKSAVPGMIAAVLGLVALVLGVMTVWTAGTSRALQQKMADNQVKLSQAQAAANLDNNLVQLLAKAAVDDKDAALRELLRVNGVTLKQDVTPATTPKPEATSDAK